MKIQLPYYFAILLYLLLSCGCQRTNSGSDEIEFTSDLIENFANPPIEARPKALWTWLNGNADSIAISKEMEAAKEKGMGGFDIWDVGMLVDPEGVVPNGPPFLSDSSLAAIAFAVDEGDRLGLEIGLVLSSSWNAGGHWIPPQFGAMGLFRSTIQVHGPALINQKIPFPELPEMDNKRRHKALIDRDPDGKPSYFKEVAVLAIPVSTDSLIADTSSIIDVSAFVDREFTLSWSAPPGDWTIIRYVCTGTGQTLSIPSKRSMGRMMDHFSKEAMKFNLDYIFEKLESVLDPVSGRSLKYLYTDSYEVNSGVWTPNLPEAFKKRKTYSLKKFLPVIDGFTIADHEITDGFKFDLSKVLSDLIIENHYQFAREYCEDKGIGFAAEAGGPGPPVHNVPFEDLKALGALSLPRGEFWLDHPRGQKHVEELQIIKGIASAAHLYNLPFVEAESFTSVWLWQEGPGDLKAVADRAFCEGLNKIVYHTFPHTPRNAGFPGWVYNFGTLIHLNNVWWEHSEVLHHYLSRASYLLQQGSFKGQVLYYYGDQAPNFVPPKKRMPDLPFGYDYDYINTDIILNKIDVVDGQLVLPAGNQYDVLVLLKDEHINPMVLKKIEQLVSQGSLGCWPETI